MPLVTRRRGPHHVRVAVRRGSIHRDRRREVRSAHVRRRKEPLLLFSRRPGGVTVGDDLGVRRLRLLDVVGVGGDVDEGGADQEVGRRPEAEESHFENAGGDGGEGGGEALEDVVGVLQNNGDVEASESLQEDDAENNKVKVLEGAVAPDLGAVFENDADEAYQHGGHAHLDVPGPHGVSGPLQNLLLIHTAEAGGHRRREHRREPQRLRQSQLRRRRGVVVASFGGAVFVRRGLDDDDAAEERDEREPLPH
mmetsp:Transcript_1374/g.4003  ORF Transcript_1374/g.4003 Transcript_1374/m.4003 type:complete len:252 (-) Transcript_1374:457-1212(-)